MLAADGAPHTWCEHCLRPWHHHQHVLQVVLLWRCSWPLLASAGAGKTLVAAEVIRRRLPELKAAGKAVCFMAPTNPLVEQVCHQQPAASLSPWKL
jgi:hypothetical protein